MTEGNLHEERSVWRKTPFWSPRGCLFPSSLKFNESNSAWIYLPGLPSEGTAGRSSRTSSIFCKNSYWTAHRHDKPPRFAVPKTLRHAGSSSPLLPSQDGFREVARSPGDTEQEEGGSSMFSFALRPGRRALSDLPA